MVDMKSDYQTLQLNGLVKMDDGKIYEIEKDEKNFLHIDEQDKDRLDFIAITLAA